jgi:hypothetical protein
MLPSKGRFGGGLGAIGWGGFVLAILLLQFKKTTPNKNILIKSIFIDGKINKKTSVSKFFDLNI